MTDNSLESLEGERTTLEIEQLSEPTPRVRIWLRSHVIAGTLIMLAILSILVVARVAADPALLGGVRDSLDGQQATVAGLAAGAAALSATLSLVPGDALSPLADQLAT